jgi:hypothetical protein
VSKAGIVIYDDVNIVGINGININGQLYDASFYNVWSLSDIGYESETFAQDASNALFNLFNTPSFSDLDDLSNEFVVGISQGSFRASYTTVFEETVSANQPLFLSYAYNNAYNYNDSDVDDAVWITRLPNLGDYTSVTYVDWTLSEPTEVPAPATLSLFILGLLFISQRKRKLAN